MKTVVLSSLFVLFAQFTYAQMEPQLMIKCEKSESSSITSVEIYGTLQKNGVSVENIKTVVYSSEKNEITKHSHQGGSGTAGKLACVFSDILGAGSSLAIYDTLGTLTLADENHKEILFNNCINYL